MSGAGIAGSEELLAEQDPQKAPTRQLLKGFLRHRLGVVSLVVLVILLVTCFGAGVIAPYSQGQQDLLLGPTPPSPEHWLGTDELGRDYLSEILFAGQVSLAIGLSVALLATVVGTALGAIAGYVGGWIGELIMRITDLFLIVPAIALLAVILQGLGPSPTTIVLALTALGWTYIARVVRAQVLSLREKDFIDAARGIGASGPRIVISHLLPNLAGVIAVAMSLAVASSIIAESTLSFLGFGVQPPQTSWGSMLSQAAGYVGTPQVYLLYFPGLFILVTVLCVNFIGDGLRDALDPQGKNL
ncbi:Dipeptide transport system permease protein DppC [Microbacterium oxydans]|uniref:Dipeptide transport system permease protein DppC n=1 Tax=Microbacterium oxydans TaxID=82380 RepID=A0A0F0KWG6_9MICO|nr:ABC transporter permease [Microbacterium oxydans]KJL24445.1 Dipeptide transport system permease protein DppC [Microbacterium oxydans]